MLFLANLKKKKYRVLVVQVDTLEIHLRETADFVDQFFLLEATLTHKGENKSILWKN